MKPRELTTRELARKIVGDGKLPNKYFITISNEIYHLIENEIQLKTPKKDIKWDTIAVTNTFGEAKTICDNIWELGYYKNYLVTHITIEDRLSGQIREYMQLERLVIKIDYDISDDTKYTKSKMESMGLKFE